MKENESKRLEEFRMKKKNMTTRKKELQNSMKTILKKIKLETDENKLSDLEQEKRCTKSDRRNN